MLSETFGQEDCNIMVSIISNSAITFFTSKDRNFFTVIGGTGSLCINGQYVPIKSKDSLELEILSTGSFVNLGVEELKICFFKAVKILA